MLNLRFVGLNPGLLFCVGKRGRSARVRFIGGATNCLRIWELARIKGSMLSQMCETLNEHPGKRGM